MNKKILGLIVALLAVALMLTPLAIAKPWTPKNNIKFETFAVSLVPGGGPRVVEYIPSQANPNKIITSWVEEPMTAYTITVGGVPYSLGVDFEYVGVAVYTAIGKEFAPNAFGLLAGDKVNHFRVDYMYTFIDGPSGIDGTLEMLAITSSSGGMAIRSLRGTGDLQNVQIMATAAGLTHIGIVSGWPD